MAEMLRNPTKSSCQLIIWLYLAARKIENCSLYSERLSAYLKIKDFITKKGRMDVVGGGNYFSVPYCPVTSDSGQRGLKAKVCSLIHVPSLSHGANSYPALTGQFLKQN